MIKIDDTKCIRHTECLVVDFCPYGALSQEEESKPIIDYTVCSQCMKCMNYCMAFYNELDTWD